MKRLICIVLFLLVCAGHALRAQDDLWPRILAANTFTTLEASFEQVRHSSMLTEDLTSRGKLWLCAPDKMRWEVTSPIRKVSVFNGAVPSARRFRLPSEKDFSAVTTEEDGLMTVTLIPQQRDYQRMFRSVALTVDAGTLLVRKVLLVHADGDWTSLSFSDVHTGMDLDANLFETK